MGLADLDQALDLLRSDDVADFGQPVADATIAAAENALGIRFPPSYREFVKRVGFCAIGPRELYGITRSGLDATSVPSVIFATRSEREAGGLPPELLLIEESGGGEMYVLDTRAANSDGEAPVKMWTPAFHDARDLETLAPDFGAYVLDMARRVKR
jgi:hypothetical protein